MQEGLEVDAGLTIDLPQCVWQPLGVTDLTVKSAFILVVALAIPLLRWWHLRRQRRARLLARIERSKAAGTLLSDEDRGD
jgi:hypothetical protein